MMPARRFESTFESISEAENWSYKDFVLAWFHVDTRAMWVKVRLAGAVETRYGDGTLERYAEDVGVSYSTLLGYRVVDRAYPAEEYDEMFRQRNISVNVAKELAGQDDRKHLLDSDRIWTQKKARELVQSRRPKGIERRKTTARPPGRPVEPPPPPPTQPVVPTKPAVPVPSPPTPRQPVVTVLPSPLEPPEPPEVPEQPAIPTTKPKTKQRGIDDLTQRYIDQAATEIYRFAGTHNYEECIALRKALEAPLKRLDARIEALASKENNV